MTESKLLKLWAKFFPKKCRHDFVLIKEPAGHDIGLRVYQCKNCKEERHEVG